MNNKKRSNPYNNSDYNKRKDKFYENESKGKSNVDNYGRKVWDKEYYQKLLDEKSLKEKDSNEQNQNEEDELILKLFPDLKKKNKIVPPDPSERKLLEERTENLSLEKNLGKVQIITQKTTKEEQGGYYCKICDCTLKDSQTYLDHINGKNHNRMLGYSMKVKNVTLDDIKKKLSLLKEKKNNKSQENIEKDLYEEAKKGIKELQELEEKKMHKRKEKKLLKKLEKQRKKQEQYNELDHNDDIDEDFKKLGLPTSFV
ncbi:zinc finger protein, putative [Plasmodium vinckei]|uniref:Zinc finger protein, putative n=1 Tax=Plasmodium vinckei TaxID=5860 RepID=A0A6V7TGV3_PLAVN|nr:zinc finger protein, putative [Plasmodium vinckei]